MDLIVPLAEAGTTDRTLVGSKAKELGRLLDEGVAVPDGFVVTTDARALADEAAMPPELRDAIAKSLDEMPGRMAYRSSAVAEDLGHASYAGQYETVLNVEGLEQGIVAVQRCWDSASESAVSEYRASHGDASAEIAVLVQRMVDADAAGVAFTANPVTGADEIVIEATRGLGDALMAGDVTPERWVVSETSRLDTPGQEGAVLDEAQVDVIATECAAIARQRGEPLDVEWALEGDRLLILQARPITALPLAPTVVPPEGQTWTRADAYFPVPMTPLAFSAWLPYHSESFSVVTERLGLPFDRVDHLHWFGRVYDRVVPLGEPKKDRPLPPLPLLKLAIRTAPPFRKRMAIAAAAGAEDRPMEAVNAWENGGRDASRARTHQLRAVDRTALSDAELADHLSEVRDHVLQVGIEHFTLSFAGMFILAGQLGMLMEELLDWDPDRLLDLVQGYGEASTAHGTDLDALASTIAGDSEARRLLETDPTTLSAHFGDGGVALRHYLDQHGHRVMTGNLDEPTWAEDPIPLLRMVRARLDHPATAADPRTNAHAAEEEANALIADPVDREHFAQALARARKARPYGDETETDVGDVLAVVRYIAHEAGSRLSNRRDLQDPDDIFYFTIDELDTALRHGHVPEDTERRRSEHRWALANQGPASIGPEPGDTPPIEAFPAKTKPIVGALAWSLRLFEAPSVEHDGDGVRGIAASPGSVSGPARVIRSPEEFDRVRPGDIMVCHHTQASWSPVFPILGGLVTEHGGPLSHPGTLAREYGLPAVLAVKGATKLFSDGQLITIDGASGVISHNSI